MRKVRILIVDDHALFAEALEAILAADPRFEVVGRAGDGREAVEVALRETPDVTLMDIAMPVMDGIEAATEIRRRWPGARVLVLTGSNAHSDVDRARQAGVVGYVTKDRIDDELADAILEAAARCS